jgi:tetratricopeptide (TPR) repeat protein
MLTHSTAFKHLCLTLLACMTCVLQFNEAALAQSIAPDNQPRATLSEARAAMQRGDWMSAETIIEKITNAEPKNRIAYFELAQLYENTSRIEAAKNIYRSLTSVSEADKINNVVTINRDDKKYTLLLSNLALEKLANLSVDAGASSNKGQAGAAQPDGPAITAAPASVAALSKDRPTSTHSSESAPPELAMRQWVSAWQSKQKNRYFASYIPGYKGTMPSAAIWQKLRTERINKKSRISVNVSDVNVTAMGAEQAQVSFTQTYRSKEFNDTTKKTLIMVNRGGRWLIAKETTK